MSTPCKTNNSTKNTSPKNASPKNASPKNASPKNASPKNSSPKNASPKNASPKNASPKNASPEDMKIQALCVLDDNNVPVVKGEIDFDQVDTTKLTLTKENFNLNLNVVGRKIYPYMAETYGGYENIKDDKDFHEFVGMIAGNIVRYKMRMQGTL